MPTRDSRVLGRLLDLCGLVNFANLSNPAFFFFSSFVVCCVFHFVYCHFCHVSCFFLCFDFPFFLIF